VSATERSVRLKEDSVDCDVFSPILHYIMRTWQQDGPLLRITLHKKTRARQYFNIIMTQTRDLLPAGIS
jgi:hypothetical protein